MTDFFRNLASQVLGTTPEVEPLIPSRFTPWPGIPNVNVTSVLQETTNSFEQSDAAQFPALLVDFNNTDLDVPMPTFRQMRELRSSSRSTDQPEHMLEAQDRLETVDSGQSDFHHAVEMPDSTVVDNVSRSAPAALSASNPLMPAVADEPSPMPVTRPQADKNTDEAVIASHAPMDSGSNQPLNDELSMESDQAVLPPPVSMDGLLHPSQAEPFEGHEEPVKDQIKLVKTIDKSAKSLPKPVEAQAEAIKDQPKHVKTLAKSVKSQLEPTVSYAEALEGHTQPVKNQSELVEARVGPNEDQPDLDEGHPPPVEDHKKDVPVQPMVHPLASTSRAAQPASSAPSQVVQRQPAPGSDQLTASLAPPPVLTAKPDLAVTTQVRAAPKTTLPSLLISSPEPDLHVGLHPRGSSEPAIVPAPEPAPSDMWSISMNEDKEFLTSPLDWANTDKPEAIPTVRVTIGRVIVRASPTDEPPPSRQVELPRPPLSLEEYLKSRQGGER